MSPGLFKCSTKVLMKCGRLCGDVSHGFATVSEIEQTEGVKERMFLQSELQGRREERRGAWVGCVVSPLGLRTCPSTTGSLSIIRRGHPRAPSPASAGLRQKWKRRRLLVLVSKPSVPWEFLVWNSSDGRVVAGIRAPLCDGEGCYAFGLSRVAECAAGGSPQAARASQRSAAPPPRASSPRLALRRHLALLWGPPDLPGGVGTRFRSEPLRGRDAAVGTVVPRVLRAGKISTATGQRRFSCDGRPAGPCARRRQPPYGGHSAVAEAV